MTDQGSLFDPPDPTTAERMKARIADARARLSRPSALAAARRDRDIGMGLVELAGEESGWNAYCDAFIVDYLLSRAELFCDDLWAAGLIKPPNMKALGPRIRAAARAGLMRKSGRTRPSILSKMGHKPIWLSLIFEPEETAELVDGPLEAAAREVLRRQHVLDALRRDHDAASTEPAFSTAKTNVEEAIVELAVALAGPVE